MSELEVLEVEHESPEYREAVALRAAVLRAPLGLEFTREELALERAQHHFICRDDGVLVGVLVLAPFSHRDVKMRQVAVSPNVQGRGVGRTLVTFSEQFARRKGFERMTLHARLTAVPFYLKLGYEQVGEEFEEVTIPHVEMRKRL